MTDDPKPTISAEEIRRARLVYLAVGEILADDSTDPEEVARREWLKQRLDEQSRRWSGRIRL